MIGWEGGLKYLKYSCTLSLTAAPSVGGWSVAHHLPFPLRRDLGKHCIQESGRATGLFCTGAKYSNPGTYSRSESVYQLHYPDPQLMRQ